MRILHTSDWHVGKTLRGLKRIDEQRDVLRELVEISRAHEVDAVLVAGDVYESASPTADAQDLVTRTLMGFARNGAEVVVIAGNHDHAATFDAFRPLFRAAGITVVGRARTAADGGVVTFTARSTGEPATLAVLPFLPQRYAARAAELVTMSPADSGARYDELVRQILTDLAQGFRPDAVNLVMAHLAVQGGAFGGGERQAQSIFDYVVGSAAFPADAHYVALGHLHRRQHIPAPCPAVHYCGSPINVDFGEERNQSVALVVDASPSTPASITEVPITTARQLRTVTGTLAQLAEADFGDDLLRVVVTEEPRVGLREAVQELQPNTLVVQIDGAFQRHGGGATPAADLDRRPADLFAEYLATRPDGADTRLQTLFAALLDRSGDAGVHDDIPLGA